MSKEQRFISDDILEDMVTLCDGLLSEFGKSYGDVYSWRTKSLEEKKDWVENFAREHAHPVKVSDESDYNREYRMRQRIIEPSLWDFNRSMGESIF